MFKVLNGIKTGADLRTMLAIYDALITSTLMYGAAFTVQVEISH